MQRSVCVTSHEHLYSLQHAEDVRKRVAELLKDIKVVKARAAVMHVIPDQLLSSALQGQQLCLMTAHSIPD